MTQTWVQFLQGPLETECHIDLYQHDSRRKYVIQQPIDNRTTWHTQVMFMPVMKKGFLVDTKPGRMAEVHSRIIDTASGGSTLKTGANKQKYNVTKLHYFNTVLKYWKVRSVLCWSIFFLLILMNWILLHFLWAASLLSAQTLKPCSLWITQA